MKAVWSLWTKPITRGCHIGWQSKLHHLLSWVLSVETAKKHYPRTALYTDTEGADMLINGIGLEFQHVSTELNLLNNRDPDWWALGKIYTYSFQSEPFVHIDSDAYLVNPLPSRLTSADLFVQNPEYFYYGSSFYRPEKFEYIIHSVNGWLPEEFEKSIPSGGIHRSVCCGLLGGKRIDFITYYAEQVIKLLEHPENQKAWKMLDNKIGDNIIFEQYFLSACVAFHANNKKSPYSGIELHYLFNSEEAAHKEAAKAGYTHLLAGAKRNPHVLESLEKKVKIEYPHYY